MKSIEELDTISIKVSLYKVDNQEDSLYDFDSWCVDLDTKTVLKMAKHSIVEYVNQGEDFRYKVDPAILKLYNLIDGAFGGDVKKIEILQTHETENACMYELSGKDYEKTLAYLYIEILD